MVKAVAGAGVGLILIATEIGLVLVCISTFRTHWLLGTITLLTLLGLHCIVIATAVEDWRD